MLYFCVRSLVFIKESYLFIFGTIFYLIFGIYLILHQNDVLRHDALAVLEAAKALNNGDFQIVASLRIDDPADPKKPKAIAFANGEDSCTFAIRDTRNGDYALLNNDILSIKCEGIVN